jgi:LacI family transcriptional regulator
LLGFDDFELADVLGTPLTVVRQTPTGMARAAAELRFKKIANLQQGAVEEAQTAKMLFPTDFIIRRWCRCLAEE